jgi:hypothetical protein
LVCLVLEALIKRAGSAAILGTLLSAPSIAIAASNAEYHDKKPISISGVVEHVVDWTTKLAQLGCGLTFLAEFSGRREIKKKEN